MTGKRPPRTGTIPDAAPIAFEKTGDWVLGGEAAIPAGEYGPSIPSRMPAAPSTFAEIRHLERRMRERLSLLPPSARRLPLRFLWSRYRQLAMLGRSTEVDDFGRDPGFVARIAPVLDFFSDTYFRTEVIGIEHLPDVGPAILVANHSGALPCDAAMLMHAVWRHHPTRRMVRPLIEDFIFHAPYVGVFLNRLGAVRAHRDNAERLLADRQLVAVFPEGEKGPSKLFKRRYQLQRFGRGGFIRLALRSSAPIIPVAIVGAEETYPMLGKITRFTRSVGLPFLPLTPTFPWLGPLGLMPLPSRWRIHFGQPIDLSDQYPADSADDRLLVARLADEVRDRVQGMLELGIEARGSTFR